MKDADVGDLILPKGSVSDLTARAAYGEKLTFEVSHPFMLAVVLPSRRVVPFDAEPRPRRACDGADIPNGAQRAII